MNGRDWAAVILATGVAVSAIILCLTVAFGASLLSDQGASLVSSILGVMVGAVAVYLGFARASTRDDAGQAEVIIPVIDERVRDGAP